MCNSVDLGVSSGTTKGSAYRNGQDGTGLPKRVHCRAVSWKQLVVTAQIGWELVCTGRDSKVFLGSSWVCSAQSPNWLTNISMNYTHTDPMFYFVNRELELKRQVEYSRWLWCTFLIRGNQLHAVKRLFPNKYGNENKCLPAGCMFKESVCRFWKLS